MQEAESRSEFEAELRQQLAQQAAAHSDHLVDALCAQRVKLEAEFEKRLIVGLQAERERMIEEISAVINRVDAVEAAVDGQLCSAVILLFIDIGDVSSSPPFDIIWSVMVVWRITGIIIKTVLCCVVYDS